MSSIFKSIFLEIKRGMPDDMPLCGVPFPRKGNFLIFHLFFGWVLPEDFTVHVLLRRDQGWFREFLVETGDLDLFTVLEHFLQVVVEGCELL